MRKGMLQAFSLITFLIIILFVSPAALASSGWTKIYQGESMDFLTPVSIVQTLDGGYATAISGMLRRVDNVGYEGHFSTSYELQILKTDSNGGVQWKRSYPTVEDPNHVTPTIYTYAEKHVIVQTADQGYVVAGGGFWLFKVNAQGTVLWSRTYMLNDESSSYGNLYSMIQTKDGGFALAGSVDTYEGGKDFWLIKTNSAGVAQWNQTFNSGTYTDGGGYVNPRDDEATCVIQTSDGGYALVGSASLFSSSTSSITYSSWVVKTNSQGNQVWNKGYDLLNIQGYGSTIIQTSDNGYAIAGTQNNDFCLFKIKSSNQFEWSQIYGDQQTDTPCALVQLEDDGYALAGTWTPTNMTATRETMGLLRTDSSGKILWTKTYVAREDQALAAYSSDRANAMIRTSDRSYVIVGSTLIGSETHQDVFFVKTETLEQYPPPATPLPTPQTSEPSATENPAQTSQPSSSPTQSGQTQSPTSSSSNEASNPSIIEVFNQEGTLIIIGTALIIVIAVVVLIVLRIKRK
jgi:hypothetical protein